MHYSFEDWRARAEASQEASARRRAGRDERLLPRGRQLARVLAIAVAIVGALGALVYLAVVLATAAYT